MVIPKECKRLAEVDFPIAEVSKHSAREKSIRHGHPSTLHLWWARRPLAACRAMLLGLLLPDPCDSNCPEEFKAKAREALVPLPQNAEPGDEGLRKSLLRFIGDFANWDLASNSTYLKASRALVKAAHPEETPLVVDPFAGGGSIPLEALRLGCEAFASDLNPVACLILKVMLEDIPRHGPELAEELRRVGGEIKQAAEKELVEFYPEDQDGAKPIAYLWARTVKCESPNCGAEIPLMRSLWLCTKPARKRALRYKVVKSKPPRIEFEIFEPRNVKDVRSGTVARGNATCPCCNMVLPVERVRTQLAEQRGGADVIFDDKGRRTGGTYMMAVVTLHPGKQGRSYRLPNERDYKAVWKAQKSLEGILGEWERAGKKGLCPVPDEPLPPIGTLGFRIQRYGMLKWGDLFTTRQRMELLVLAQEIRKIKNGDLLTLVTMAYGRCVDHWSSSAMWIQALEAVAHTFGRQALPIVWDFVEAVGFGEGGATFDGQMDWVARVLETNSVVIKHRGQVHLADAAKNPLPDGSASVWFTDPPYYDAIPYSDLSDYFYVWAKRILNDHTLLNDPFNKANMLTPKEQEAVQDETKNVNGRPKDRAFFEDKMADSFTEARRFLGINGIGSVVFAHKTTEGWESLLTGLLRAGWVITASWPISTERPVRLRSLQSAALAGSVHLVCRPRPNDAPVGDWGEVLKELPKRVGVWIERLQSENIRGADLVFACIGPALEIFSRYSKVETADGQEVKLDKYLEKVWEVVGRTALEQILGTEEARARNGMAGVLEEDARLTALFLWTVQSTNGQKDSASTSNDEGDDATDDEEESQGIGKTKGYSLPFDVVRRFAQPLGIELSKWEERVIETDKGVVRLMAVSERAKQLFGKDGADSVADWLEHDSTKNLQQVLFPDLNQEQAPKIRGRGRIQQKVTIDPTTVQSESMHKATTLDRVHAAMLLQASGQANALRALIKVEQERGQDFLRLSNALSALYPTTSEEKRLLDAMLLAVPR